MKQTNTMEGKIDYELLFIMWRQEMERKHDEMGKTGKDFILLSFPAWLNDYFNNPIEIKIINSL